jgi:hypothetical protein
MDLVVHRVDHYPVLVQRKSGSRNTAFRTTFAASGVGRRDVSEEGIKFDDIQLAERRHLTVPIHDHGLNCAAAQVPGKADRGRNATRYSGTR